MADSVFVGGELNQTISSVGRLTRINSSVEGLAGGGYVVTWQEAVNPYDAVADPYNIYAQIFDADGVEIGSSFVVNTTTADHQTEPDVTVLSNGDFVIAWQSDNQDGSGSGIYSQRYNSTGVAQGSETLVNTITAGEQEHVEVSALSSGGYVVAWTEAFDNGDSTWTASIKIQEFTAAGVAVGGEITLHSDITTFSVILGDLAIYHRGIDVVELTGGELAISWTHESLGGDAIAQMRLIDNMGNLVAGEIEPEQSFDNTGSVPQPHIIELGNGNVMIVYAYTYGSGSGAYGEIYGRIYTPAGVAVGNEFAIAVGNANRRFDVFAESDGFGGAMVGWREESDIEPGERPVVMQQVMQDGTLQGSLIWVDVHSAGRYISPEISLLANGDLVITFQTGINTGTTSNIDYRIVRNGEDGRFSAGADTITLLNTGEIVAALEGDDQITGGTGDDIISGGSGKDIINSGAGDDIISGGDDRDYIDGQADNDLIFGDGGDDVIEGGSGDDIIDGGIGNDTITGGADNDIIYGGLGADTINGGDGDDYIYGYRDSLRDAMAPGDESHDEGFTNILNGGDGNDQIYGGRGDDVINGGDGDDRMYGMADYTNSPPFGGNDLFIASNGDDTIRGVNGFNTVDYTAMGVGITIIVLDPSFSDPYYEVTIPINGALPIYTQDLHQVSYIIGTAFNDSMTGGDDDDIFEGAVGNDIIAGGLGNDTARYSEATTGVSVNLNIQGIQQNTTGAGLDTLTGIENLTGSAFGDTLRGNAGVNILSGDDGADFLYGSTGADQLFGGAGDDYLYVDHLDTLIDGGADYDRLFAEAGSLALNIDLAASNLEYAQGSAWDDIFDATNVGEAVKLWGHGRDDKLTGSAFADYINGGSGNDTLIGLGGEDTLDGSIGADIFNGGAGDDIIYIDADDTIIDGGADYDQIHVRGYSAGVNINITVGNLEYANGNTLNDIFDATGATWSVKLLGQGGNDTLTGGDLADQLYGGPGNDILFGNGGDDILNASTGADQLSGGAGNDIIFMDADDTLIDGGADYDRVYANGGSAALTLNLTTANVEYVSGSAFGDNFDATGSTVAVKILGQDGADTLTGGNLADLIYGGAGADNITGGTGNDFLSGGGADGAMDTFFFGVGWGDDTLSDFQNGEDILDLSALGTNFAALTITALGANNSVVSFGGNSITLLGMQLADVDASDFVFV